MTIQINNIARINLAHSGEVAIETHRPWQAFSVGVADGFLVENDGTVLVYDDVAGHFTGLHALSPRQERRLRRMAREYLAQRAA